MMRCSEIEPNTSEHYRVTKRDFLSYFITKQQQRKGRLTLNGVQDMLPQNMAFWHIEYLKLEEFKKI